MLALDQTWTYSIVREWRIFEINPINPLTQLDGAAMSKMSENCKNNFKQIQFNSCNYVSCIRSISPVVNLRL